MFVSASQTVNLKEARRALIVIDPCRAFPKGGTLEILLDEDGMIRLSNTSDFGSALALLPQSCNSVFLQDGKIRVSEG